MTIETTVRACAGSLRAAGLSDAGVLESTGVALHLARAEQGTTVPESLDRYAANLLSLSDAARAEGAEIPADFWDVCSPAMKSAGVDEYAMAERLSRPEMREYVALLGRSYRRLCDMKTGGTVTAVSTALAVFRDACAYVRAGHATDIVRRDLKPEQQAVFLWQQLLTGTNRQVPYLHREAYTHGIWGRFNVAEIWRYRIGKNVTVDEVWGLSGLGQEFIGDATNTNQVEHMAISALAQCALRLPVFVLDLLEELEWMLRKGTRAASRADERLNRAVARDFLHRYTLADPGPACESLERVLAG
jgi:hypothetical protein